MSVVPPDDRVYETYLHGGRGLKESSAMVSR